MFKKWYRFRRIKFLLSTALKLPTTVSNNKISNPILTTIIALRTAFTIGHNRSTISYRRSAFFWCTSLTAPNAKAYFAWRSFIQRQLLSLRIE